MAPQCCRPLQTALDDTQGRPPGRDVVFEKGSSSLDLPSNVMGMVFRVGQPSKGRWVYDSAQLGPDITALSTKELYIWVEASTIYTKDKMVRQVLQGELFTMWDYGGKEELKTWSYPLAREILNQRLRSPPAKMLRSFVFTAGALLVP